MKQEIKSAILLIAVFLCCTGWAQAQDTIMYHGGNADGYSLAAQANFTPTNLTNFVAYQGGQDDGYTKAALSQFTPSVLATQSMYLGSSGDGYVKAALSQFTPSLLATQSMYLGSFGDGHSMVSQQNFTPSMLAHFYMYAGNNGDGFAADTQYLFTPSYLTHFTPYAGGEGDGYAGTLIVGVVLPVKLMSFTGTAKENGNLLEWKVSFEKELRSYDLQRSPDSKMFETLHTQLVKDNTTQPKTYHYLDTAPLEGNNFYRLQMNNIDNTTEYSNIVLLVYKKDGQTLALFPNPAQDMIMLQYQLDADAMMRITDVKGALLSNQKLQQGKNTIQIPISHLAQGAYLLQVVSESGINKSIRFIKQ